MRFGNLGGRIQLVVGDGLVDVGSASGGRVPADPVAALEQWDALVEWARPAEAGAGRRTGLPATRARGGSVPRARPQP